MEIALLWEKAEASYEASSSTAGYQDSDSIGSELSLEELSKKKDTMGGHGERQKGMRSAMPTTLIRMFPLIADCQVCDAQVQR